MEVEAPVGALEHPGGVESARGDRVQLAKPKISWMRIVVQAKNT